MYSTHSNYECVAMTCSNGCALVLAKVTLSHLPGPSPPPPSHFGPRERAIPSDITLRVSNGLIHRENEGSRLRGSSKGIGFHHGRLPDTRLKVVRNVLLVDVYTIPLEPCETVMDRNKVSI